MFGVAPFGVVHRDVPVGAPSLGVVGRTEWSTHSLPFSPLRTVSVFRALPLLAALSVVVFPCGSLLCLVCSRRVLADLCAL